VKYKKICPYCNKGFNHRDKRQKFCSRKCYEDNRKPKEKLCLTCGKKIIYKNKHYKVNFCSVGCSIKNNWKNGIYTKEIIRKQAINSGNKRRGKIKVERIKKRCPICNKEFINVPNYARQVTFCSYKCGAIYRGRNHSGKKSILWKGGTSFEPYDFNFNNNFKNSIRQRDNQICLVCGIHREKLKKSLDIHHIDYNKLNTCKENCISLCRSCHCKTSFNREHWTKFFQSLLSEKYGYVYSS
jgi:endogenous inhibitor of DNA gyrase (YacG/DUF329 family)